MTNQNQDSNYTLFVRALLKKDLETLDISPFSQEQKSEIEKVANIFFERNMILESLQTFYILRNTNKLIELGNILLKNKQNEFAFEAFRYAMKIENFQCKKIQDFLHRKPKVFMCAKHEKTESLVHQKSQNDFLVNSKEFFSTKSQEGLSKVGEAFLSNAEIEKAHTAFKLANNKQMLEFIESNFDRKF